MSDEVETARVLVRRIGACAASNGSMCDDCVRVLAAELIGRHEAGAAHARSTDPVRRFLAHPKCDHLARSPEWPDGEWCAAYDTIRDGEPYVATAYGPTPDEACEKALRELEKSP